MHTKETTKNCYLKITVLVAFFFFCLIFFFPADKVFAANVDKLNIMVMSDSHVLTPSLVGNTEDLKNAETRTRKMFTESSGILEAQLEEVREKKPDVLLLCGDLTKDGELESHRYLEERLENLKQTLPDLKIYVTDGNHDVNNSGAKNYNTGGAAAEATRTTPEDFYNNYQVTFDDSSIIARYTPQTGKAGMLSYVARPKNGFTFIVIDSCRYSADNTDSGTDEHETSGQISSDLEDWVLEQIKAARKRGDVVLGMQHHNMVPHYSLEAVYKPNFMLNDYERLSEEYADAGMYIMFTGHKHSHDIAQVTSQSGNVFYDMETGSGINYASQMRKIAVSRKEIRTAVKTKKSDKKKESKKKTTEKKKYKVTGYRVTVNGRTIEGESVTYTDPADGQQKTIDDIKDYGASKILTKKYIIQKARKNLKQNLALAGKTYDAKDYSDKVSSILTKCMNLTVDNSNTKTLYQYVRYAYLHYLAGEDGKKKPEWFQQADVRLKNGSILQQCLLIISDELKDFDSELGDNICQYLFFPQQYLSRYELSSKGISYLTLAIPVKGPDVISSWTLKQLNAFYADLMTSFSYDDNFPDDKTFTIKFDYNKA